MFIQEFLSSPLRIFYSNVFNPVYKYNLAKVIASLCKNNAKILDVGCDDGSLAKMIMGINTTLQIYGVDIQANRSPKIQLSLYNGYNLPFVSDCFDIVFAIDVLHHVPDIPILLQEMARVSKSVLIIKDHVVYSVFSQRLAIFTDYVSNFPYDIACCYNFASFEQWNIYFKKADLRVTAQQRNVHFGFGINERYNPVFTLKK
jgi:SAM-dependent methyltransferase